MLNDYLREHGNVNGPRVTPVFATLDLRAWRSLALSIPANMGITRC